MHPTRLAAPDRRSAMTLSARENTRISEEEVQGLLATYARTREVAVRDKIVLQYTNLVESIARRFTGACEPVEDLAQEGYIGLITAVDLYDATKGVKFSTYATHFVIGQIKHYLRDKGKIIKEPAWLQELNQRMSRVMESLSQELGRPPTEKEIGEVMGIPEDQVTDMLTTREVFKVSSLDAGTERDDGSSYPMDTEKIKDQKTTSFQLPLEDKIVLETATERLKDIEQKVIQDFFYKDLNQTEIAKKLNISCNYVSHILRNSTKKLKKILQTDEIRDAQIQVTQLSRRAQDIVKPIEQLPVVDSLTGVYNKQYFFERLDEEISRACRHNDSVGIIFIQVEFPENVGRLARLVREDDVMQQAATRLRASVRKADVLTRFENNVFALILPHTGEHTTIIAQRLEKVMTSEPLQSLYSNDSISIETQTSFAYYPEQGSTAEDLAQTAINALGLTTTTETMQKAA